MTNIVQFDERRGLPSASGMHRVDKCSGSEALIALIRAEGKIDDHPSPEAASGRRVHSVLANAADVSPLTESEIETAKACLEIRDRLLREWAGGTTDTFFTVVEERFFYDDLFTGQPDFVALEFKNLRAFIVNYKTGRKQSEAASDNLQLRTEVVLVKHAYSELIEIDAAIVEPMVDWDPVRVRYSTNELSDAEAQIRAIVEQARLHSNERQAGDWCTFCPARVYCPEAQALAISMSESMPAISLPRGQDGARFWEALKTAKKLIAEFEQAYTEILEDEPDALPGYTLPKQGPLHWVVPLPRAFRDAFAADLTNDEIDGALTWNIGKLRELYGLKHHLKGRALEEKFKEVAGESIKRLHGQPFIRPLTKKEKEMIELKGGYDKIKLLDGPIENEQTNQSNQ